MFQQVIKAHCIPVSSHIEKGYFCARPLIIALVGLLLLTENAYIVWAEEAHDESSSVYLSEHKSENELYEIQNPFAYIPRLFIENQFNTGEGNNNSMSYGLHPRPVLPFHLTDDLALITRTTFSIRYQEALTPDDANRFELGDTDMELYFTPKNTWADGTLMAGAGPILHFPTATQREFGLGKWGLGPAGAVIWQPAGVKSDHGWTFSFYANHLFDIAGNSNRETFSVTYLQPGASYTFAGDISLGVDIESVYDSISKQWVVPINFTVSQLINVSTQPIVVTAGGRYFAETPAGGPDWGGQLSFNFLFPD